MVLNFVAPEARYANDVNNRLKIRGWKNSWVEHFVTRGIVTKITKISTPENYPLYGIQFLFVNMAFRIGTGPVKKCEILPYIGKFSC